MQTFTLLVFIIVSMIHQEWSKTFDSKLLSTDATLKATFLEALGACEPGNPAHYPTSLPALPFVFQWIQKLIAENDALAAHLAFEEAARLEREAAALAAAEAAAAAAAEGAAEE